MSKKIVTIEKKQKIEKRSRLAKKAIICFMVALSVVALTAMTAFAADGAVDTTSFIQKTITVLKSIVSLIGAGLSVWGVVNLVEGYSGDNAAAKSQGIKQLMAGLGLILVAIVVIPVLQTMMTNAMSGG